MTFGHLLGKVWPLVCYVLLCFCHFPIWCPGYLIVLIPDLFLLSISTASAASSAPPDVKRDLINAIEKRGKAYDEFQKSSLEENTYKGCYERQPKLQLKTFIDLKIQNKQKFLEKMSF